MPEKVLEVKNVSKRYKLYSKPIHRLKEAFSPNRRPYHHEFYALRNINLSIQKGECAGIIGMNGSGKSTLLKIITNVLTPSQGTVAARGRIAALLELGSGFNPELSGVQNIFFQCSLMGMSRKEVEAKIDEIISFADIGEYINQPVKTYSSGMYVRLAFSVAINVDPEILIVDEALSVGDIYFQAKCLERIRNFKESGRTLLFVSHDATMVKSLCSRAFLLHKGRLIREDLPKTVFNEYAALLAELDSKPGDKVELHKRSGDGTIRIVSAYLATEDGEKRMKFVSGDPVVIRLTLCSQELLNNPTVGILIRDNFGKDVFGVNTNTMALETGEFQPGVEKTVQFKFKINLGRGIYRLTAALHKGKTHLEGCFDWVNDIYTFNIINSPNFDFSGYCRLYPTFEEISVEPER